MASNYLMKHEKATQAASIPSVKTARQGQNSWFPDS